MIFKVKNKIDTGFGKSIWSAEDYNKMKKEKKEKETFAIEKQKEKKKDKKELFLEEIKNKETISEQEILLIRNRLNRKVYSTADMEGITNKKLLPEQNAKGFRYMYNLYKSSKGTERSNSPFGYREEEVLNNFSHFELVDWNDSSNYYQAQAGIKNYVPVYRVVAKDGSSFEYFMQEGKVKIIG